MTVSVREVAARAGVSVGTVSNVLNHPEKVATTTVERVQAAIAELGFIRNDAARQLRAGSSRSLGMVVLDIGNPFFADIARGAGERAAAEGVTVLVGSSDNDAQREANQLELFREQRVKGVLLTPVNADEARIRRLCDAGINVVLVDVEPKWSHERLSAVTVDDVAGGYLAGSHLLSLGRRRIAFVAGRLSLPQVADRLTGLQRAAAEVPGVSVEVIEHETMGVLDGRAVGEQLATRPAAMRPDAVFCANDLLAIGVLQGLSILGGISVPSDVALIGYDDIDFAAATVVPLSSIRQPARDIGATAVGLLFDEGSGSRAGADDRVIRFDPELIVRASTAG